MIQVYLLPLKLLSNGILWRYRILWDSIKEVLMIYFTDIK